jgi:hypothetical protein
MSLKTDRKLTANRHGEETGFVYRYMQVNVVASA